ncbi:hypothetical protein RZS08_66725, partial [Arthrospira platensis SPKY1]|nr:hypothetical protein [Arthrospira platensis SPKY1]
AVHVHRAVHVTGGDGLGAAAQGVDGRRQPAGHPPCRRRHAGHQGRCRGQRGPARRGARHGQASGQSEPGQHGAGHRETPADAVQAAPEHAGWCRICHL